MKKYEYQFDDLYALHNYGIDLSSREIFLVGEVDAMENCGYEPGVEFIMANTFIRNMRYLINKSSDPIIIHMKTCGGDWQEGLAIFDTIKTCPAHVTILNYTHARSMSSIILQAADKRIMMPNSHFMYHRGIIGMEGELRTVESHMAFSKNDTKRMLDIYTDAIYRSHRPKWKNKTEAQIGSVLKRQMMQKGDVFLTAEEAIEWGFADEIYEHDNTR